MGTKEALDDSKNIYDYAQDDIKYIDRQPTQKRGSTLRLSNH